MELAFLPGRRRHEIVLALGVRRRKGARSHSDSDAFGALLADETIVRGPDDRLFLGDRVSGAERVALREALIEMAVEVRRDLRQEIDENSAESLGAVGALRASVAGCLEKRSGPEQRELALIQWQTQQLTRFRLLKAVHRLVNLDALPGAEEIQCEDERRERSGAAAA